MAERLRRIRETSQEPSRTGSQIGRIIGKTFTRMADDAQKLGEGMERVFGENMTRPGDGFNQRRAGERARQSAKSGRIMAFSGYDSEKTSEEYDKAFFSRQGYKNDLSNDENFWDQRGKNRENFY